MQMTKIFISYRREDSSYIANMIYEKLEQHFGVDSVFFDIDSIPLGTDFRKRISDSVGKCNVLLAIIGDSWINSVDNQGNKRLTNPADFVRIEIESALKRDIPVIPVLVGKARMPSTTGLPAGLQDFAFRNAAEVRAGRDLQQHLARLVKDIESLSQFEQPKNYQAQHESPQSSSNQSNGIKVPIKLTSLTSQKKGLQQTPWKRWVFSASLFISFFFAGLFAASGIYQATDQNELAPWIVLVPTWLVGIALIYVVWRRY
jgi:TIR domain-containing protein